MKKLTTQILAGTAILALAGAMQASADTLVINANTSDPGPKQAFEELVERFEAVNPDIQVELNIFDHEGFKTTVRNFLTSKQPDIITWFAGNRMKTFVDRDLLEDVSDVWEDHGLNDTFGSSKAALTVDDKQYGVPYSYYQWGVYYRKDIFDDLGLTAPATWDEFMTVNATLKENGITPITIGTKFLWTAAGWFDYLNIRINGLDFHLDLAAGNVPYTDDSVRAVFAKWQELLDNGYFIDSHASYSWQEAQAFMFQGDAAMYLIGNFFVPFFPEDLADSIDFFPFPVIDPDVAIYEDAPTDTVHIPKGAKNKDDARKFLAFIAQADNQAEINTLIGTLPPNADAPLPDDRFLQAGFELLSGAAGTAQFYDRDTDPEMAKIGMGGFQEFMVNPDRVDAILERLEKARQRIYR